MGLGGLRLALRLSKSAAWALRKARRGARGRRCHRRKRATSKPAAMPPMAMEQPIILRGAMLSPKAMAQPTMMMARLAVFATECLRARIPVELAALEAVGSSTKAVTGAPRRVPSHPEPTGAP